jgi:hypothetical protein
MFLPPANVSPADRTQSGIANLCAGLHLICMVAEGNYFHGAAALCNSLARQGFHGLVLLGYRGALPEWAARLPTNPDDTRQISPLVSIRFVSLGGSWHLSNLKASFMQSIVADYPAFQTLYYLDVDIIVTCRWDNFIRWAQHGVVLCLDVSDTYMPESHVFRREWQALAQRAGYCSRAVNGYFNAGCVGLGPRHVALLQVWARLIETHAAEGADMTKLVAPNGRPEFTKMDQDLLNAALMATDVPIALLGKEAMGGFPTSQIMTHAMIFKKPWRRNYLLDALKGFPPGREDLEFWAHVTHPLVPFTPATLRRKRLQLRIAQALGWIRRRSLS